MSRFLVGRASLIVFGLGLGLLAGCSDTTDSAAADDGAQDVAGAEPIGSTHPDAASAQDKYAAYMDYMTNYAPAMASCLQDEGFDAEALPDGGLQSIVAPEQKEAYDAAFADCKTQLGYEEAPPVDDEVMGLIYDGRLDVRECLIAHGYSPVEPSSREEFIDTNGAAWNLYEGIPSDEALAAQQQCPSA